MKPTYLLATLLCLLLTCTISYGQDETPKEKVHKNELSLNIKQVINGFWAFPQTFEIDPYMLQYRRYMGNMAIRAGAGATFNSTETTIDTISPLKSKSSVIDLRAGLQVNKEVGQKFNLYFGADIFYNSYSVNQEYFISYWGFINNTNTFSEVGLAPLLGVQFYITPRISISTESALRIGSFKSTSESTYSLRPEQNRDYKSDGIKTQYWAPNSIYLNIRF